MENTQPETSQTREIKMRIFNGLAGKKPKAGLWSYGQFFKFGIAD